jgi:hypothetical protein
VAPLPEAELPTEARLSKASWGRLAGSHPCPAREAICRDTVKQQVGAADSERALQEAMDTFIGLEVEFHKWDSGKVTHIKEMIENQFSPPNLVADMQLCRFNLGHLVIR